MKADPFPVHVVVYKNGNASSWWSAGWKRRTKAERENTVVVIRVEADGTITKVEQS